MTANEYVSHIIQKHKLQDPIDNDTKLHIISPLEQIISEWAGVHLCDIKLSGSRAKGTAIDISTDLDLFISLSSKTPFTLKYIYDSLYKCMKEKQIEVREQNVSIGIIYRNKKIDLVPATRQGQYGNDHSLYLRKTNTWTKTNIDKHITFVRESRRLGEITALKIWRENHKLEFPSIYLECFAIEALKGRPLCMLAENFLYLLQFISDNILTKKILDPANTNNILSNELTQQEKRILATSAKNSLCEQNWRAIIW